jgi:hypothetical protein
MSFFEEIYSFEQLHSLIKCSVITKSFLVNSTNVNILNGVKEIRVGNNGIVHFKNLVDLGDLEYVDCDFSFWGNMSSLNKLKYIGGEFRFGAPILSLGLLKEVKGDLRPTSNELCDLGALEVVGGTLDLRGMVNLRNLGNLKYVGGNLNLVKSLKSNYDLSNITVKGRIIYWNKEPNYFKLSTKTISTIKPPPWEDTARYEFENNLIHPDQKQQEFYNIFKENFENGNFIDLGGNRNYVSYYTYSVLRNYHITKDFDYLSKTYDTLRKEYPDHSHYTENIEVEIGRELKIEKYLNCILPHEEYELWEQFIKAKIKKVQHSDNSLSIYADDDDLLEVLKIGFKKQNLTGFGIENLEVILERLVLIIRNIEAESKEALPRRFFDKGKYYKSLDSKNHFDPLYYEMFFDSQIQFNEKYSEHKERNYGVPEQNILYPNTYTTIMQFAVENYVKKITRDAENQVREQRGLPKVSEGWISETNLFYQIKNAYPNYLVVHHGKTKWLGLQHFDIYFPEINIAIEYQGKQHTEIIEYFGGEESFNQSLHNDRLKKEKCKTNNCILIEVFPEYNFEYVKAEIDNAIKMKSS